VLGSLQSSDALHDVMHSSVQNGHLKNSALRLVFTFLGEIIFAVLYVQLVFRPIYSIVLNYFSLFAIIFTVF